MNVTKEMHDKELQAQYGQFRTLVSLNSKKWGLKLMNSLVRLTKGQKVKNAVNETHSISSTFTKGHKIRTREFRPEGTESEVLPAQTPFMQMCSKKEKLRFFRQIIESLKKTHFQQDLTIVTTLFFG